VSVAEIVPFSPPTGDHHRGCRPRRIGSPRERGEIRSSEGVGWRVAQPAQAVPGTGPWLTPFWHHRRGRLTVLAGNSAIFRVLDGALFSLSSRPVAFRGVFGAYLGRRAAAATASRRRQAGSRRRRDRAAEQGAGDWARRPAPAQCPSQKRRNGRSFRGVSAVFSRMIRTIAAIHETGGLRQ